MSDLIDRQAAIDAICKHGTDLERRGITILAVANYKQVTVDLLETLPAAQPTQNNRVNSNNALDTISRQAAIANINKAIPEWSEDKEIAIDCLKNTPSAQPEILSDGTLCVTVDADIKAVGRILLSQDGTHFGNLYYADTEPELDEWCTDCKEYDKDRHCCPRWNRVIRQTLEDAQPERKTGRWVKHNESTQLLYGESKGGVKCSECGYTTHNKMHVLVGCPWKYCPNCGAKMEGAAHENQNN